MHSDFEALESVIGILYLIQQDRSDNAQSSNDTILHDVRRILNSTKRIMCRQLEIIRQLNLPVPDRCMHPTVKQWYVANSMDERRNRDRLLLKMIGDLLLRLGDKYRHVAGLLI